MGGEDLFVDVSRVNISTKKGNEGFVPEEVFAIPGNRKIFFSGAVLNPYLELTSGEVRKLIKQGCRDVIRHTSSTTYLMSKPEPRWFIDLLDKDLNDYLPAFDLISQKYANRARKGTGNKSPWVAPNPVRGLRKGLEGLDKYILIPNPCQHNLALWADVRSIPMNPVRSATTNSPFVYLVLNSRVFEIWSRLVIGDVNSKGVRSISSLHNLAKFPLPKEDRFKEEVEDLAEKFDEEIVSWRFPKEEIEVVKTRGFPDVIRYKDEKLNNGLSFNKLFRGMPPWFKSLKEEVDSLALNLYEMDPDWDDFKIARRLVQINRNRCGF